MLKQKLAIFLLSVMGSACLLCACNETAHSAGEVHFSDEAFKRIIDTTIKGYDRSKGLHLIDSLYATASEISPRDKYRYYDFKRNLFELIRYNKNSWDTAIIYSDSVIDFIETNHLQKQMHKEYVNGFRDRSKALIELKRFNDAIVDISRCRELNAEAGDSCLISDNVIRLSEIAIQQSDYPLAISLAREAIAAAKYCERDDKQFVRMQSMLNTLGFIYTLASRYDSAIISFLDAEKYIVQNRRLMGADTLFPYDALENVYGNLVIAYTGQKDFGAAELYSEKAIRIDIDILKDSRKLQLSRYLLADAYFQDGRIKEADELAQLAAEDMRAFTIGSQADFFTLRAAIEGEKKNYKKQLYFQVQMQQAKDSLVRRKLEVLKENPFVKYEQLDRKYQVALLKKDNVDQETKTRAAVTIGILLALLLLIFLYFLWKLRALISKRLLLYTALQKTMAEKEVAETLLREKELLSQAISMQMEFDDAIVQQRARISDDMHDEICSSLAALKFYTEAIATGAAGTRQEQSFSAITTEVNTIYESARRYMHNLKTNNWESAFSLTGFLKEIQQKFTEKKLMKTNLSLDEGLVKTRLNKMQHDELYHIIKECIANAIRHADASELSINISFPANSCTFSVADNGKGYVEAKVVNGIGLESILKRIKNINGEISINSSPQGTTINGHFDLN